MTRPLLLLLAACLVLACRPAAAADPLELELGAIVEDVAGVLKKRNQDAIRVGLFAGDGRTPSDIGPEIQRVLVAGFAKRGVKASDGALIEIKGDYGAATKNPAAPAEDLLFIRVTARLIDTETQQALANIDAFSRAVYGNPTVAKALALSVALPADADLPTRNRALREAVKRPATVVAKSLVRSTPASPFAAELLVSAGPQAPADVGREATLEAGFAYVEVAKGECYRLRVHNAAAFDVAVSVSIDGLDLFAFSDPEYRAADGQPALGYVVVPKGQAGVVAGWFRTEKRADAFLVAGYAQSAAKELNAAQSKVGQVCVQFHAAWEGSADKPPDEAGKDAATARGEPVSVDLVRVKRQVGAVRDQVAIRYRK